MKPSDGLIVSSVEPTGLNRKKVWMQKGKNLFNKDVVSQGCYLGADGLTYPSTVSNVSGHIEIKAGVSYILSFDYSSLANTGNRAYDFYDEDKKILSSKTYTPSNKTMLLTPEQNGYLRFAYDINCTNIQLEQGSIATEYEEYIEPKIYVRNDNNVYEEFIGKEEALHGSVFEAVLPDVETNTNVSFIEMFPRLNLDDVICFNVEITDVYSTWDRTYAHILKNTGVLQVRSFAEKQMVTVRVTAFYK